MSNKSHAEQTSPEVIHRHMTIDQILSMFPYKAQRLSQEITLAGLHCIGCHAATTETLEAGMYSHGMGDEAIERLLKRLNSLLQEPETDREAITLTPSAAKKFMEIAEEDGKQGWGLRFGDRMAGCNGFEYILDFSEKAEADDEIFESLGIQLHVNKHCTKRLKGSVIDFRDGLQSSGFIVENRNAKSSCGCGSSHNY
jgi:iron-sulfur cluster assembly protein